MAANEISKILRAHDSQIPQTTIKTGQVRYRLCSIYGAPEGFKVGDVLLVDHCKQPADGDIMLTMDNAGNLRLSVYDSSSVLSHGITCNGVVIERITPALATPAPETEESNPIEGALTAIARDVDHNPDPNALEDLDEIESFLGKRLYMFDANLRMFLDNLPSSARSQEVTDAAILFGATMATAGARAYRSMGNIPAIERMS